MFAESGLDGVSSNGDEGLGGAYFRVTTNKMHNRTTQTNATAKMINAIPHPLTPFEEETTAIGVVVSISVVVGGSVVVVLGEGVVGSSVVFEGTGVGCGVGTGTEGVGTGVGAGVVVGPGVGIGTGVGADVAGVGTGVGTGVGAVVGPGGIVEFWLILK
jgi:hypothetical protein